MKELQRVAVDEFKIENSVRLEELNSENVDKNIISLEELFAKKEMINLNKRQLELFLNGVNLSVEVKDGIYRIYNEKSFIGLGIVKNELLKRDVIVN